MSALTVVMRELSDLNPDEFFNLRAYYASAELKDFRSKKRRDSTSSDSSGISSLTSYSTSSSSSDKDSVSSHMSDNVINTPQTNHRRSSIPNIGCSLPTIKEDKSPSKLTPTNKDDLKITYKGRDLLNLEGNIRQPLWMIRPQMVNTRYTYEMFRRNMSYYFYHLGTLDLSKRKCRYCGFVEPARGC